MIGALPGDWECHAIDLLPLAEDLIKGVLSYTEEKNLIGCHLIGYSLGGRLALQLKERYPDQFSETILLSAHPGLAESARAARLLQDEIWTCRLETLPFVKFLELWYAEPLFDSLRAKQETFQAMLARRKQQDPKRWAHILKNFSPAKMPLTPHATASALFLYGEQDTKYKSLYSDLQLRREQVAHCGHALPLEAPQESAAAIEGGLFSEKRAQWNALTCKAIVSAAAAPAPVRIPTADT